MSHNYIMPIFADRSDAGRKLAERLLEYAGRNVVVLAIPNGGVAVAVEVALALSAPLDLIISRKIPMPLNPEAGFGSITDDGTIILNESLVKQLGLTQTQIAHQVDQVRASIRQRSLLYHAEHPPVAVTGRTVIIVDDGLASGYTMRAAIASLRKRRPEKIIVATPVAPEREIEEIKKEADRVVVGAIGTQPEFYVADYYRHWRDITEREVLDCLAAYKKRYQGRKIGPGTQISIEQAPGGGLSHSPYRRPHSTPGR